MIAKALAASQPQQRRRGQKKPIPESEKTERYYERRSRNNIAAKKSRDSRKLRETLVSNFVG